MNEVFEKIVAVLRDTNSWCEDEINLESDFYNDLGFDSLDFIELIMSLEREFDITIPDDDVHETETMEDMVNVIKKLTK